MMLRTDMLQPPALQAKDEDHRLIGQILQFRRADDLARYGDRRSPGLERLRRGATREAVP
jgi:hypothetical protein